MTTKHEVFQAVQMAARNGMTLEQKRRSFMRQQSLARDVAASTLFCSVYGLSEFITPYTLDGVRKRVSGMAAISVDTVPLMWRITCYALCRDGNGNEYIKGLEIALGEPVKQSAINQALSRTHYDWMSQNVNQKHLLTLAWIATTAGAPDEAMAMKLFDDLGAWSKFDYVRVTDSGNCELVMRDE